MLFLFSAHHQQLQVVLLSPNSCLNLRSTSNSCRRCSAHQAVARGARGTRTSAQYVPKEEKSRVLSPGALPLPCSINTMVVNLPDGKVGRTNADHHLRLHAALEVLCERDLFVGQPQSVL